MREQRINRWGTDIEIADGSVPFKVFHPRPQMVSELFEETERFDDREYLVHGAQRLTYSEVRDSVHRAASKLTEEGIEPGSRVMLLAANSVDWVIAYWATIHAGATLALGNGWWSEEEMHHAVALIAPDLILVDERTAPRLPVGVREQNLKEFVADSERFPPQVSPVSVEEESAAIILSTSGTTGLPKGAVLSHRSLIALQHGLLSLTNRLPEPGVLPDVQVTLHTGPLFHMGGVQGLMLGTVLGQRLVFLEGRFSSKQVLDLIEGEEVNRWGGVPTMITRVLSDPSIEGRRLESLRSVTLGGSPVSTEVVDRLHRVFPNVRKGVSQIYGMSEAGGTLTSASGRDSISRPGTAGRALPLVELRIDNPDSDGVGEVRARTPTQMSGYLGESESSAFDSEGWLHTGDLGYIDEDGYLFVTGRLKEMVIRGGENVATPHVESVLLTHPDVTDVAVIGLPDADLGEIVAAAVQLREESEADPGSLRAFLGEKLAYFEVPEKWWLWTDSLPVNAVGKVDKRLLQSSWPTDESD